MSDSRLFPTPPNSNLIRSLVAGKSMLDKTQIGQNLNNMARGLGNGAMAGASAIVAAPGMVAETVGDMNKSNLQEYNREQSRRSAGRYQQKETPEEYNRRKANEMMGVKEEPSQPDPPSIIAQRMLQQHNALKSRNRQSNQRYNGSSFGKG
jgi:predicted component of type VI protein secretion system